MSRAVRAYAAVVAIVFAGLALVTLYFTIFRPEVYDQPQREHPMLREMREDGGR